MLGSLDIGQKITDAINKDGFDEMLTNKLTELSEKPEGMMLQTMAPMVNKPPPLPPRFLLLCMRVAFLEQHASLSKKK